MLNLTIFSLLSSRLYDASPFLVNNRLSLTNCHFQYFLSTLFLQPKTISLQNSHFNFGLGSVLNIHNEDTNIVREVFQDLTFNETSLYPPIDFTQFNSKKGTISILNCYFRSIIITHDQGSNGILDIADCGSFTIFMAFILFANCQGSQQIIRLGSTRCVEITHSCFLNCTSIILQSNSQDSDFTSYTFVTHHQCQMSSPQVSTGFLLNNGYQYFRCLNFSQSLSRNQFMTTHRSVCLSVKYLTFYNVVSKEACLLELSNGDPNSKYANESRYLHFLNVVNDLDKNTSLYFRITGEVSHNVYITNSIFLYENSPRITDFGQSKIGHKLYLYNCYFKLQFATADSVITENCSFNSLGFHTHPIAHFTTLGCEGPAKREAININVCGDDDSFEGDQCDGQTLTFPTGVIPFSTLIPPTETFSPTSSFSSSSAFTKTQSFTSSTIFSFSDAFEKTFTFSQSQRFTTSASFEKTIKFTESNKFTKSTDFTTSNRFSISEDFTCSSKFSGSSSFTKSKVFEKTIGFSGSYSFSSSTKFTNSVDFSPSTAFDATSDFTSSCTYTQSEGFTESSLFSPSNSLSESFIFTNSDYFGKTSPFTKSNIFTESLTYTKSNLFTQSTKFTISNDFTVSNSFSLSFIFTKSRKFDKTDTFPPSFTFSESNTFTPNPVDINQIKDTDSKSSSPAKGIGIGVGIVAGLVVIGLFIAFIRKRNTDKILESSARIEEIETIDPSVVTHIDLGQMVNEDDPFADDFNDADFNTYEL